MREITWLICIAMAAERKKKGKHGSTFTFLDLFEVFQPCMHAAQRQTQQVFTKPLIPAIYIVCCLSNLGNTHDMCEYYWHDVCDAEHSLLVDVVK